MDAGGRTLKVRHLKPSLVALLRNKPAAIVVDPQGGSPRSTPFSLVKLLLWLAEEWCANLFQDNKNIVLLCDRYYHDLLIDWKRYRYGGPLWVARLVGNLMPRPRLWILLDAPAEVFQARKQEVPAEETVRQRLAYLAFVRKQQRYIVVDASQSLDRVIAYVAKAIMENV